MLLATKSDIIHQSSLSIQNSDECLLPLPLSFLHIFLLRQILVSTFNELFGELHIQVKHCAPSIPGPPVSSLRVEVEKRDPGNEVVNCVGIFQGCLSDDDGVTLVPYYGNHHPTHDSLALYVPMLASPRSGLRRIGAAYTRHEFLSFAERFHTQVQVLRFSDQ